MTYIYLNKYPLGYLYVGSHTWKGEGIDSNYHGSSRIARSLGWLPTEQKILEVVSSKRRFIAEKEWIEKYCQEYGIADCALCRYPPNSRVKAINEWIKKFKSGGLMLNLHAEPGGWMYAQANHTKESYIKAITTRKERGFNNVRKAIDARIKESYIKAVTTRCKNGTQQMAQRAATAARDKAVTTRCKNGTQYKCISPDGEVAIGSNSQINNFVRIKGIEVRVDGWLSRIHNGSLKSPVRILKGKLKGFIISQL